MTDGAERMQYPLVNIPAPPQPWGERLRYYRRLLNVSQSDLAERSGRTQSTVSDIETGKQQPERDTQVAFAQALGMLTAALFPRDEGELELVALAARYGEAHPDHNGGGQ